MATREADVVVGKVHRLRNFAFYRAGWRDRHLVRDGPFWTAAVNNFLDIGVLEWCKLFGDQKDPHFWGKIVADQNGFEAGLYSELKVTDSEFVRFRDGMRAYRNRFVAHLDSELTMRIPQLDLAVHSTSYYHSAIVAEAGAEVLTGMPLDANDFYRACSRVARDVYASGQTT